MIETKPVAADTPPGGADRTPFELCMCAVARWRHARTETELQKVRQNTYHTEVPHHLFMDYQRPEPTEVAGSIPSGSFAIDIEDALRCTAHIEDRGIRAAYIGQDLRIRGYVVTRRGADGHFEKVT